MRTLSASLVMLASLGLAACGGDKPAKDPSTDETHAYQDETPKWEGASRVKESPPPSKSGAGVNEAPTRRSDQYDKEATEVPLGRATRQVKENCGAAKDENGKATGPWGKVTIQVMLGRNGHSREVTVPEPYAGKPVGRCIEKAFSNLQFPPWAGADTQVDREVELVQPK